MLFKNYTAGTNKGGSAALFFGLKLNVEIVFAGACQYRIGTYLYVPEYLDIFKGMMGKEASQVERDLLDKIMPNQIELYKNQKTEINLIFSKKEHTYLEHISDLLSKLKEEGLNFNEKEFFFEKHGDCGYPFIEYVTRILRLENKRY